MTVISHQIYEIRRGVRHLALHTTAATDARHMVRRLRAKRLACFVQPFGSGRANVFFGRPDCVAVARRIAHRGLDGMSDEEDFILGLLLGYDCRQQCERYLQRRGRAGPGVRRAVRMRAAD